MLMFARMLAPTLALWAGLPSTGNPSAESSTVESSSLREQRPTAVWFQPQLRFHALGAGRADLAGSDMSALPLGLEVGRQLTPHLLVSATIAHLPNEEIRTTQVTGGARWYFARQTFAPYVAAELGLLDVEENDTGGRTHTDVFAVAGPGAELTLRNGLSLMTDLQLGPESTGSARGEPRVWNFSAWYRLGVGYRF
jgi:hypothetical protein